jgi:HSP20 family protein
MTNRSMTKDNPEPTKGNECTFTTSYIPPFDVYEDDNEILLSGDLPGVTPDQLDIRFENRELTIHGNVSARMTDKTCLSSEYGIGDFHREFTMGEHIDAERITAEMKNGVLTLHLPKLSRIKPRKITVTA